MPTTSGTGSETTRTAILTRADHAKVWLWGDEIKADEVVLDPELTKSLPPGLTAATGIDALVHAVEAATNRNANPAANLFAYEAIRLVGRHLACAIERPGDLEARGAMQWAAAFGGVAIDNCGTAIAHALGHAMGSLKPIHHGRAVGVAMLACLPWNVEGNDAFAPCAAALGAEPSASGFIAAYEKLLRACGLKLSVAEEFAGVGAEALAAQAARPENAAMRDSNKRGVERRRFARTFQTHSFSGLKEANMLDRPTSKEGWLARAAALKPEGRAFVDGAYVGALSGKTFARTSPIDGKVFAHVADCGAADVDRAVASAAPRLRKGRMARRRADAQEASLASLCRTDPRATPTKSRCWRRSTSASRSPIRLQSTCPSAPIASSTTPNSPTSSTTRSPLSACAT